MEQEWKYEIRKLSPKEQEEVRKKIVREMKKRGNTRRSQRFASICPPCEQNMGKISRGRNSGNISGKDGTSCGAAQKANSGQEEIIKAEITTKNPSESGLNGYLWCRALVCELVKQKFGVETAVRACLISSFYLECRARRPGVPQN